MRIILRTAALSLAAALTQPNAAVASTDYMHDVSFSVESVNAVMHVVSTDHKKWDKLNSSLSFTAHMAVSMRKPGYVVAVGLVQGNCTGDLCSTFPPLSVDSINARAYAQNKTVSIEPYQIPVSTGGAIAVLPDGDDMINECNQHLSPDGPTHSYSFFRDFWVTFVVNTDTAWNLDNAPAETPPNGLYVPNPNHTRSDKFQVRVMCDPIPPQPASSDLKLDHGSYKVTGVDLTVQQISQLQTNGIRTCPRVRVKVEAEANQVGPVSVKLWTSKGGSITSQVLQKMAAYNPARNGYFAAFEKTDTFTQDTFAQYKAEVQGGTFTPQTDWKGTQIHCQDVTGNTMSANPPPSDNHPTADWNGGIKLFNATGKAAQQCPHDGHIEVAASSEVSDTLNYRISCTNGAFFAGAKKGTRHGVSWVLRSVFPLHVTRTRTIACTLQEVKGKVHTGLIILATGHASVTCVKHNVKLPDNGLKSPTRPPEHESTSRGILILPTAKKPPPCASGYHRVGARCVKPPLVAKCKSGYVLAQGKCIKKPTVSILCKPGYTLSHGKCIRKPVLTTRCKPGTIRAASGKCIKPIVLTPTHCKRGQVLVRGKCISRR